MIIFEPVFVKKKAAAVKKNLRPLTLPSKRPAFRLADHSPGLVEESLSVVSDSGRVAGESLKAFNDSRRVWVEPVNDSGVRYE
jgi:hypothetical protein